MTTEPGCSDKDSRRRTVACFLARCAVVCLCLGAFLLSGCAGGSLFNPQPLIGKDRLVFQVVDQAEGVTYYTRNIWFDGDNFRFRDVYGRDKTLPKAATLQIDLISIYDYYETPI